jgi:PAS domain S-box-containing protein
MLKKRILIVEDEQLIALDMGAMLEEMGYEVAGVAGSGEEALEMARRAKPDLALMDIFLAGEMDGIRAAAMLHDELRVPVVYLTAHSERDTYNHAVASASYGYLVKPVGKSELFTAVETALRLSALDRELRRSEERYRRSENKYREMLDSIDDFVFTLDDKGILLYAGLSSRSFFGMEPWRLIGTALADHVHPADRDVLGRYLDSVVNAGEPAGIPGEFRIIRENGEARWIEARMRPFRDGEGSLVACRGVARDIADRKKSETALRESERNFRLLVENIHDGIFLADEHGKVVYANGYAAVLTGYPVNELQGLPLKGLIKKDDLGIIMERYNDRLKRNLDPDLYETMLCCRDGGIRPIEVSIAVTEWQGGKVDLIIFKDITERRKAEDGLRSSLAEKDTLIKEVHHRVKNNFQIVMSLLSLQGRTISDEVLAEKFRDAQNRIRAMALIHEKLYQSEEFSSIDFAEYIGIIAGELQQVNARRAPGAVLAVRADNIRLNIGKAIPCGLILNELVTNAFKHAFPEGFAGKASIEVDFHGDGDVVELAVSDNGVGLPAHMDPENSETLGLNLVRLLSINQLKGELLIHRTGSLKFTVRFSTR